LEDKKYSHSMQFNSFIQHSEHRDWSQTNFIVSVVEIL